MIYSYVEYPLLDKAFGNWGIKMSVPYKKVIECVD